MNKRPDWQQRIGDVFTERLTEPFRWGSNDCCLFAADCFEAATEFDPGKVARGMYADARGALRMIEALGSLEDMATGWCGPSIHPSEAAFGDIGLIENSGRPCLAVFGGQYFHAPGDEGLTIFPVETCLRAWRLP